MPEEDALQRCDRLSRAAIAAYDEAALKRAQEPWLAATCPQEGLEILREILRSRADLRVTGMLVVELALSSTTFRETGSVQQLRLQMPTTPAPGTMCLGSLLVAPCCAACMLAAIGSAHTRMLRTSKWHTSPLLVSAARVVSIIEPSPRRENLVGVLLPAGNGCLFLAPLDNRMPRCMVQAHHVAQLPKELRWVAIVHHELAYAALTLDRERCTEPAVRMVGST